MNVLSYKIIALTFLILSSNILFANNNMSVPNFAQLKADKENLERYLSGSVELKGVMANVDAEGNMSLDSLSVFVRNGAVNSWASWLSNRKTSYYRVERKTFGLDNNHLYLSKTEYFRGPIEVEATEKGLAIRFFAPSPNNTTDFTKKSLRTATIAYVHVPHDRLFNQGTKAIDFVLPNLKLRSVPTTGAREYANADSINGFFWAKENDLFGNADKIAVSDKSATLTNEFKLYSTKKVNNGSRAVSSAVSYYSNAAYDLATTPSAYDLAMLTFNIMIAGSEFYLALNEAAILNPMALTHFKMAWGNSKTAFAHYNSFMSISRDVVKGQMEYLSTMETIADQGYLGASSLATAGAKAYALDPSALLDLAKAARFISNAWKTYGTLYPAAAATAA